MEPTSLEDQISFWFMINSCQEVFSAINIPAITTDYYLDFIKALKNVISLIGNLASSVIVHIQAFVFNDSSVVRLKE